jgi:YHS domain-containing protein
MTRPRVDHVRAGDPARGVLHDAVGPLGPGQVCDPDPVYGHSYQGVEYCFCSLGCAGAFAQDPTSYKDRLIGRRQSLIDRSPWSEHLHRDRSAP